MPPLHADRRTEDPLRTPAQFVPGVGPERANLLAKMGLRTVEDLLWHLPREMLDLTEVRTVHKLQPDLVQTVRGTVVDLDGRNLSGGRSMTAVLLECEDGYVRGIWFNQAWRLKEFRPGDLVLFSGKPKRKGGRWEFHHPQVQRLEEDDPGAHGGMLARYGLTEGLRMHEMRRIVRAAVEGFAEHVADPLPQDYRDSLKLPPLRVAVRELHLPENMQQYEQARRRLLFDDLLDFQLGLGIKRRACKRADEAPVLKTTAKIDSRIRRLFPFRFTAGQDAAVREICEDLASGRGMHRLLQADVGAGKTAVAIYAMLVAVANGCQSVLMAPTEVLAEQHWQLIDEALAHSRVERILLTGRLTPAQRQQALDEIASGKVQLVVGTQAVIQQDVSFHNLALAVIDEQHKFGVAQRARFGRAGATGQGAGDRSQKSGGRSQKSEVRKERSEVRGQRSDSQLSTLNPQPSTHSPLTTHHLPIRPHVLVMTATPIPRSLCLTQFGDLDVTRIEELPPGRQNVVTSRVSGLEARRRAWEFIRRQLAAGRQAFVVCPRVEDDEAGAVRSAEQVYERLSHGELRDLGVGLVHGQLDRQAKAAAMEAFRSGETRVLVATTVVEVGVDVPNATLMIILDAERFGLSQLHQLRGRVARGKFQGYCFLFSESEAPDAIERLAALEKTSDGFKIAEVDFELRGPGDVLGTRQHGELPLKVADLRRDHDVLLDARRAAFELVEAGRIDQPEFAPLKLRVLDRFGKLLDLPQSG